MAVMILDASFIRGLLIDDFKGTLPQSIPLPLLPLGNVFDVLWLVFGLVMLDGNAALLLFEFSNGEEYDRDKYPF